MEGAKNYFLDAGGPVPGWPVKVERDQKGRYVVSFTPEHREGVLGGGPTRVWVDAKTGKVVDARGGGE